MKSATIFIVAVTVFTGLLQHSFAAPQWGLVGGLVKGTLDTVGKVGNVVADTVGKVLDKVGEAVVEILSAVKVLLKNILGKDITAIKALIDELSRITKTLPGEAKVKVEELIAKVLANVKELGTLIDNLLNNADELTVEAVEKVIARIAQLSKKIKAALKELLSIIIENISHKGGEDISNVVCVVKSTGYKATEIIDSIVLKVNKVLEALLAELKRTTGNTSEELKNSIAECIEECSASSARIEKLMKNALSTATGVRKVAWETIEKFMDNYKIMVEEVHSKLEKAANSGDKILLKELILVIEEAMANTKAEMPALLANLESSDQVNMTKEYENSIACGVKIVKALVDATA